MGPPAKRLWGCKAPPRVRIPVSPPIENDHPPNRMVVFLNLLRLAFQVKGEILSLTQLPLHQAPLVFLDVETTGLRPEFGDRLIEVAVLKTRGLEEVDRFTSLINPQRPLDPGAMAVNGITPAMVFHAPTFPQVLSHLHPFLTGTIIVAHNAPFDLGFLRSEYALAGQTLQIGPVLDTVMLARRQYRFNSNSLGNIARTLHIATPNAHRAMGDVLTMLAIFRHFCHDLTKHTHPLVADLIKLQGGEVLLSQAEPPLEPTHPIQMALDQARKVQIQYRHKEGYTSQRVIRPISRNGNYLIAFCELKQEQRTFRLDRIIKMELLD